jgi:hypothetical protein
VAVAYSLPSPLLLSSCTLLLSARIIGNYFMTAEDYDNKFGIVPPRVVPLALLELWNAILAFGPYSI